MTVYDPWLDISDGLGEFRVLSENRFKVEKFLNVEQLTSDLYLQLATKEKYIYLYEMDMLSCSSDILNLFESSIAPNYIYDKTGTIV